MTKFINEYELEDAQQRAALQLHTEIEEKFCIKFSNFRFEIDEEDMTIRQHGEPDRTFTVKRTVKLFIQADQIEQEVTGALAEKMYKRYMDLINEYLNTDICICESLL